MSRIRMTERIAKAASITERLDRIASELEHVDPRIALAIDQVSDQLEGRVATPSEPEAPETAPSAPEAGGLFHIFSEGTNKIAIEFNRRISTLTTPVRLIEYNERIQVPSIIKTKFEGKKIFAYKGVYGSQSVTVFVISENQSLPYSKGKSLALGKPIEVVSKSKTQQMTKQIDQKLKNPSVHGL